MEKHEILKQIENCIINGSINGLEKNLDLLFNDIPDEETSKHLALIIAKLYTRFKADMFAKVLEVIIRKRPNLGLINHPNNFLFQMAVVKGSKDLYDCYIEESALPAVANMDSEDKDSYIYELLGSAEDWTAQLFDNYKECVKGIDYNGAFSRYEKDSSIALIHQENYEIIETIMEHFNAIVGRRDIIKDLSERVGL
jgi:hypothetical protein